MTLHLHEIEEIQGKYQILHKIQEGGMGAIYKVRHLLLNEIRVIKVIRPQYSEEKSLQDRFSREARAAIKLQHPNIAQLHDFSIDKSGNAYMVMEFIDGVTIKELLSTSGPPVLDLSLEIARQGLRALAYLHQRSYVHRDIAPDNLMLTRDYAGEPLVKLIDLGIIKDLEDDTGGLTGTGMFLGKVRYAAPEQFSGGDVEVTSQGDLYSFAILLYELLTGVYPMSGQSISDLIASHLFRPPKSFDEADSDGRVPLAIREAVLQGLEKDPSKRIKSAAEFESLLRQDAGPQSLTAELDETMTTASMALGDRSDFRPPGSTQGRLDDQFGLEKTGGADDQESGSRHLSAVPDPEPREDAGQMLARARALMDEEKLGDAQRLLYSILALDPTNSEVRAALAETEQAIEAAAEAARQRAEAIATAAIRIDNQIRSEHVDEAAAELESARAELGDATRFRQLDGNLEALRTELEERLREAEIAQHVGAIAAAIGDEDVEKAGRELEVARSELGDPAGFAELEAQIDELQTRLRERARHAAISDRAEVVAAELSNENLDGAREELASARRELGEHSRFADLDVNVAELQLRLDERARRAAVGVGAEAVAAALKERNPAEARKRLEKARADAGDDPRLDELEERIDEEQQAARRTAIQAALASCEKQLTAGNPEKAAEVLDEARTRLGEDGLLSAAKDKVRSAVAAIELEEAATLEAGEIGSLLDTEGLTAAGERLTAARARFADDPRFEELQSRFEEAAREHDIGELIGGVEELLVAESFQKATHLVGDGRARFGSDPRFADLEERIAALREKRDARNRENAIAVAVEGVTEHIEAEDPVAASRLLSQGRARFGAEAAFGDLEARIADLETALAERAEHERIRQRVEAHVAAGEERAQAGDFAGAVKSLQEALHLGDDAALRTKLERCEEARLRQIEEERHRAALGAAVDGIRKALAVKSATEARTLLATAVEAFGVDEASLSDLGAKVAALEEELQERDRMAVLASIEAEVEALLESADYEGAAKLLAESRRYFTDDSTLDFLLVRVQQAHAEAREAHGRKVGKAVEGIEGLLKERNPLEASEALATACKELGNDARFDQLDKTIGDLYREIQEEDARKAKIEELVENAQRFATGAGAEPGSKSPTSPAPANLEASIEYLEDALLLDPAHTQVQSLLNQFRGELETRRALETIDELAPGIEKLLEAEDVDGAAEEVATLRAEVGERTAVSDLEAQEVALRERLEQRRLEEERAAKKERVAALLDEASLLAAEERLEEAVTRARGAVDLLPDEPEAQQRLFSYSAALARQIDERLRADEIAAASNRIRDLAEKGGALRLWRADRDLSRAVAKFGVSEELSALADQVAKNRERHRAAETPLARRSVALLGAAIVALLAVFVIVRMVDFGEAPGNFEPVLPQESLGVGTDTEPREEPPGAAATSSDASAPREVEDAPREAPSTPEDDRVVVAPPPTVETESPSSSPVVPSEPVVEATVDSPGLQPKSEPVATEPTREREEAPAEQRTLQKEQPEPSLTTTSEATEPENPPVLDSAQPEPAPPPDEPEPQRRIEKPFQRGDLIEGSEGVLPPNPVSIPPSSLGRRERVRMTLLVVALIDENGKATGARVISPADAPRRLREEAVKRVERGTYEPGTKNGIEGKAYLTVPVPFGRR